MENRFKIEIVGKEKIKDVEWGALLYNLVWFVEKQIHMDNKFHVHLVEIEKENL